MLEVQVCWKEISHGQKWGAGSWTVSSPKTRARALTVALGIVSLQVFGEERVRLDEVSSQT